MLEDFVKGKTPPPADVGDGCILVLSVLGAGLRVNAVLESKAWRVLLQELHESGPIGHFVGIFVFVDVVVFRGYSC